MPDKTPIINEADLYDPRPIEDTATPEKKGLSKKQIIGLALAAVALAAIGGGIALSTHTDHMIDPNIKDKTTTESVAEKTVEKYGTIMEKYKGMDIASFDSLPRDERLHYSQYLIDQDTQAGDYEDFYGATSDNHEYMVKSTPVSSDNSGQEIIDNNLYARQIAYFQEANDTFNAPNAQKILSSIYYEVGDSKSVSINYQLSVKKMNDTEKPIALMDKITVTDTSKLLTGTDSENNQVQYKIIASNDTAFDSKPTFTRFVYHEFVDYTGKKQAIWLMDVSADSQAELSAITTIR